jgi:hypothetical protein
MTALTWDQTGQRFFENGISNGVVYPMDNTGAYPLGYAWSGLTTVTESPSGAESNKQYADNRVYANLLSAEVFGATVEAFTYPKEFAACDGTSAPTPGLTVGQQRRKTFGMAYKTKVGNDVDGDLGYKIHLIYGALAAPSEKAYATLNESPELTSFSWTLTTTPVDVPGTDPTTGKPYRPTAILTIDSTEVDAATLTVLEQQLFGTSGTDPHLPLPGTIIEMFSGTVTLVTPIAPTYNSSTDIITIPTVTGVSYMIGGEVVPAGAFGPITGNTMVTAVPASGAYAFTPNTDDDWLITFS